MEKFCKILRKSSDPLKLDKILEKILIFYEKGLKSNPKEFRKNLNFLYSGFPFSFVALNFALKHIYLFLSDISNDFFTAISEDCLNCIFVDETPAENEKKFELLKNSNPIFFADIDFYARCFLTFAKLFLPKNMKFQSNRMKELMAKFEMRYFPTFLETIQMFDNSFVLSIPLKVILNYFYYDVELLFLIDFLQNSKQKT